MVAQTKPRHTPFILAGAPHGLHRQIHSTWNNCPTSHHFLGVQIKGIGCLLPLNAPPSPANLNDEQEKGCKEMRLLVWEIETMTMMMMMT